MTASGQGADAVRLSIWITGMVQGVGMRWWIREEATARGLTGSATNQFDGTVEVIIEGDRTACAQLLERLDRRDTPGRIRNVTHRWGLVTGLQGFRFG